MGAQGFGGRGVGGGGECFFLPPPLEAKTLLHLQVMDSVQLVAGPGELKKRLSERCREGGDWGVGGEGNMGGGGIVSYCLIFQGQDLAHMLASGRSCAKLGPGKLGG